MTVVSMDGFIRHFHMTSFIQHCRICAPFSMALTNISNICHMLLILSTFPQWRVSSLRDSRHLEFLLLLSVFVLFYSIDIHVALYLLGKEKSPCILSKRWLRPLADEGDHSTLFKVLFPGQMSFIMRYSIPLCWRKHSFHWGVFIVEFWAVLQRS